MMWFNGILFDRPHGLDADQPAEPACFGDLHLGQVLASMIAGREDYGLKPLFYTPLRDVAAVRYRHEILRDLQEPEVLGSVRAFAEQMRRMREHLAQARKFATSSNSNAGSWTRSKSTVRRSVPWPTSSRQRQSAHADFERSASASPTMRAQSVSPF